MSHFGLRYLVELDKRQTSHLNSSQLSFFLLHRKYFERVFSIVVIYEF